MKKLFAVFALLLAVLSFAPGASAQDDIRMEVFGGYSLNLINPVQRVGNLNSLAKLDTYQQGWNASLGLHVTDALMIKADVSQLRAPGEMTTVMFGPQYKANLNGRLQPFVHALAGVVKSNDTIGFNTTAGPVNVKDTAFAFAVGGGVDVSIAKHLAIRPIQIDYIRAPQVAAARSAVKATAGVVLRF